MFSDVKFIDLSQVIDENSPVWPGSTSFTQNVVMDYGQQGFRVCDIHSTAGIGTHVDAPAHTVQGGRTIDQLLLQELIAPACVIDVRQVVKESADTILMPEMITNWENKYGRITRGSVVLVLTGWSQYWSHSEKYLNTELDGKMHFPGLGKEAIELLLERDIGGVGIDTLSVDAANDQEMSAHKLLLANDIFLVENLMNLDRLPAFGGIVFVLPVKYAHSAEAPARVFAVIAADQEVEAEKTEEPKVAVEKPETVSEQKAEEKKEAQKEPEVKPTTLSAQQPEVKSEEKKEDSKEPLAKPAMFSEQQPEIKPEEKKTEPKKAERKWLSDITET